MKKKKKACSEKDFQKKKGCNGKDLQKKETFESGMKERVGDEKLIIITNKCSC